MGGFVLKFRYTLSCSGVTVSSCSVSDLMALTDAMAAERLVQ